MRRPGLQRIYFISITSSVLVAVAWPQSWSWTCWESCNACWTSRRYLFERQFFTEAQWILGWLGRLQPSFHGGGGTHLSVSPRCHKIRLEMQPKDARSCVGKLSHQAYSEHFLLPLPCELCSQNPTEMFFYIPHQVLMLYTSRLLICDEYCPDITWARQDPCQSPAEIRGLRLGHQLQLLTLWSSVRVSSSEHGLLFS